QAKVSSYDVTSFTVGAAALLLETRYSRCADSPSYRRCTSYIRPCDTVIHSRRACAPQYRRPPGPRGRRSASAEPASRDRQGLRIEARQRLTSARFCTWETGRERPWPP